MNEPQTHDGAGLPAGATALPHANWVVLQSHHDWNAGDLMDVMAAMTGGQGIGHARMQQRNAILTKAVTNWSYPLPMPVTTETLRRLPGHALAALYALTKPYNDLLNGTSITPVLDKDTLADDASPTPGGNE
jgi:hypothetical protein